jgi:hypothetical protein
MSDLVSDYLTPAPPQGQLSESERLRLAFELIGHSNGSFARHVGMGFNASVSVYYQALKPLIFEPARIKHKTVDRVLLRFGIESMVTRFVRLCSAWQWVLTEVNTEYCVFSNMPLHPGSFLPPSSGAMMSGQNVTLAIRGVMLVSSDKLAIALAEYW